MKKSNLELLRIVAMMLVVLIHCNDYSLGNLSRAMLVANPAEGIARILCMQLCIVCVNVYVLISGWFGIRPSLKGAMNLFFQILFWGCVALTVHELFSLKGCGFNVSMFKLGATYWFVRAYFILYVFSPVLNAFVEKASRRQLEYLLAALFALQMIYGFPKDCGDFCRGYSALSFFWLYLFARYLNVYPLRIKSLSVRTHFSIYFLTAIVATAFFVFSLMCFNGVCGKINYNSPFAIVASISFFLAFAKMDFQSRVVNWFACSTFSVYLFHMNVGISSSFSELMKNIYASTNLYTLYAIGVATLLLIGCCTVDKLRLWLWKRLSGAIWKKRETRKP